MSSAATRDLTWDLDSIFPGVDSPKFEAACIAFATETAVLAKRIAGLTGKDGAQFDAVAAELCRVLEAGYLLEGYLDCLLSVDSFAAKAQRASGRFSLSRAELDKARISFTAWVGSLDATALLNLSEAAREHEFAIAKAQEAARRLMSPEAEAVAADLAVSGRVAWEKLYGNVTSQ